MRRLTNAEYDRVAAICDQSGIVIDQCPTCLTTREDREDYGVVGTYRYQGEERICDCQRQMDLRVHYLLANIGDQYQRLDWNDYHGSQDVRDTVAKVLDNWTACKLNGVGLEFTSPDLGVGKTFAATYVARQLVQRSENVYFAPFLEVVSELTKSESDLERTLKDVTVLVLDEVIEGNSLAQQALFATKFEELIRHRTNFNKITIMTTNLTKEQLNAAYPRTYSLLEAKQIRVPMSGSDFRQQELAMENIELIANQEVRPICL